MKTIDIHSHVIPGIDDGAKNIETTLEMLRKAEEDGTTDIVATPHFCRGYGEASFETVQDLVQKIGKLAQSEGININIHYGQEVYFNNIILEDYEEGLIGTINDSRYMLIELPMKSFDDNTLDLLYELQVKGITPIIAHPERYRPFMEKPERINKFIDEGYLFQMNSGSIEGIFGKEVQATAKKLLEHKIYNFIGSDGHNVSNRTTGISNGIKLSKDVHKINERLFEESSRKVLKNEEVEFVGSKIKGKKGLFSIFK